MSRRWWSPFDGMEELSFKPAAGGYIYRAPHPWLFARGPHYVVNETQKAELAAHHRSMLKFLFWVIVVGGASAGMLTSVFLRNQGWPALAASVSIGLAIGFTVNMWLVRKVRPIIAALAPTSDRITRVDIFRRQATVYSARFTIGFGILSLVLFALAALRGIYGPDGWDLYALLGTGMFGACTIYWGAALYLARRRASAA